MARLASMQKGGFYALNPRWGEYVISLFKRSEASFRFLDPFAGEGSFAVQFCEALNGEAFMIENDESRARVCQEKVGVVKALWADSYRVSISHDSFPLVWLNSPFDNELVDNYSNKSRRAEYQAAFHFRKYLQDGGFIVFTCYLQHLTKDIFKLFFKSCNFVHVYRFPEEHLDRYTQVVLIGSLKKGGEAKNDAWIEENFQRFEALRNNPEKIKDISTVITHEADGIATAKIRTKGSPEPFYVIPSNRPIKKLIFIPEKMDIKVLAGLNLRHGAHVDPDYGRIILPPAIEKIERPKHRPLELQVPVIIQSGLFDGLRVRFNGMKSLIRGSVQREVVDVKVEELPPDDHGKDRQVITTHNRPLSKLTILSENGDVEIIDEDHILEFAAEFRDQLMQYYTDNYQPTYDMTIHPVWAKMLDAIRFNEGKSKPWVMQRYVITCIAEDMIFSQGNIPIGEPGVGKDQPLDAKILTPRGWSTMGDMKIGCEVIGADGIPHKVTGVFPQGEKDVYRVTFTDGSSTECGYEHLWATNNTKRKWLGLPNRVFTLKQIIGSGIVDGSGKPKHYIPIVEPVDFKRRNLPIDPYLLGALIGNGGMTQNTVVFSSADQDTLNQVKSLLPKSVEMVYKGKYDYNFVRSGWIQFSSGEFEEESNNELKQKLTDLNMMGCGATTKFIPESYKFASIEQRLALLQGLIDTDGSIALKLRESSGNVSSTIEYSTSSEQLAKDVQELVRSLGGRASLNSRIPHFTYKGERKEGQRSYRLIINLPSEFAPCRLQRKLDNYVAPTKYHASRGIVKVELIGKKQTQCIMVDSEEHLYVTDDYIVTHNTGIMTSVTLFLRMLEMAKIVYQKYYNTPKIQRDVEGYTIENPAFAAYYGITNEELLDLIENLKRRYMSDFKPTKRKHYISQMQGLPVDRPVVIVCPATLPSQWVAEIKGVYPEANVEWLVNTSQTHIFFDKALQNGSGERIDYAIMTYERAKLGSGWSPAYNIEYSKNTLLHTTESDKDGAPKDVILHVPKTIDPVTGGRIVEFGSRGESFVPAKRLESKQQQYFYIGQIFDGYEWVRDISNPDVKKQHRILKKFKLRNVEEYTFQTSRHHGFACWQQARPPGDTPKIGNGVCEFHYEEIEIGLDNTFGGDPETGYGAYAPLTVVKERRYNSEQHMYEYVAVGKRNYGRKKKRVYQQKVFDRPFENEEFPDKWLAMQGIRPYTENKNRKMTSLLKKHGLKVYILGGGIKEIDMVMQELDISEYRLGGGSREFKNVRYALADFIKALYRVRFKFGKNIQKPIGFLIADEFHMAKAASSDVGIATRSLMDCSLRSAGATGTLYSGKASSVYPILFTLSRSVQREYRWVRGMPIHWIVDMGVIKQEFEERADYSKYGAYNGHKRYPKGNSTEAPGISPLLVRRVIPVAEFFGLRDAGAVMRPYKEVPIEIPMDELMRATYEYWYNELRDYNAKCIMNGDGSFTASYYQNLYLLPDAMHRSTEVHHRTVTDRDTGKKDDVIVFTIPSIGDYIKPKEAKMIELINEHLAAGDRVIVSTNQSSTRDIQPHLMALIEKNCPQAKPFIMQEKETGKRLAYIKQKVSEGNNVMITNPKKVATGLNLIMFNIIVAMDVSQELQIMAQFVKRCHRPTQPRPYVTVYYLYYDDVFQNKAVSDLADKVAANDVLNGAGRGNLAKMSKTVTDYEEMSKVLTFGNIDGFKKLTQEQMREKFATMELNPDDYKKSPWYVEEGEAVEHMSEDEAWDFEVEVGDDESQNGSGEFVEGEFEEVGEQLALPSQVKEEEIFHTPKKKVTRKEVIARLNDQFRARGEFIITQSFEAEFDDAEQQQVLSMVMSFDDFNEGNNPHGERDFGSFEFNEVKIWFKIDYYAPDMESGSEDPADSTKTKRVLTVMLTQDL